MKYNKKRFLFQGAFLLYGWDLFYIRLLNKTYFLISTAAEAVIFGDKSAE